MAPNLTAHRIPPAFRRQNCILGIDPGVGGGIAVYDPIKKELVAAWAMPIIKKQIGRSVERKVDTKQLAASVIDACVEYDICAIALEHVHSSPQMGVTSAFSFGQTFGRIEAVCDLCGPVVHLIRPAAWKQRMLVKGDKSASVNAARVMFGVSPWFTKNSCDGVAEAALLAAYAAKDIVQLEEVDPLS